MENSWKWDTAYLKATIHAKNYIKLTGDTRRKVGGCHLKCTGFFVTRFMVETKKAFSLLQLVSIQNVSVAAWSESRVFTWSSDGRSSHGYMCF